MGMFLDLVGTLRSTLRIKNATLNAAGLTAARSFTLPDLAGTLALTSQLGGGGGAPATTIEVNLGSTPTWQGKFTITDAAITTSSKVIVTKAPGPYTGKGTISDEDEMDPIWCVAFPSNGSAVVRWQTLPMLTQPSPQRLGMVKGNVKFTYQIASPSVSTAYRRNVILGGDFSTNPWQPGTSFSAIASGTYFADGWVYEKVGAMVHTVSKDAGNFPTVTQAGQLVTSCALVDCTTVDSSIAAGDYCLVRQAVEGYNFLPLAQGATAFSFWHAHTKTGTYCVAFKNSGSDRSYVAEYTQAVSGAWELATVVIPASPSAGTWDYTAGVGLYVVFTLAAGTTFQTTAGAWQTGNFFATANQVNACDNTANDFRLALVQLEKGSVATPFENLPAQEVLSLAERYYETGAEAFFSGNVTNTVAYYRTETFRTVKRAVPTVTTTLTFVNSFPNTNPDASTAYKTGFRASSTANATANGAYFGFSWVASSLL